jgi:signal transduction histidine kinase
MYLEHSDPPGAEQLHRRLELLAGVATDSLHFKEPHQLLCSVFKRISSETSADLCFCYSMKGRRLNLSFSDGMTSEIPRRLRSYELGQGLCGISARERKPQHSNDARHVNDPSLEILRSIGIHAFSCYPLLSDDKLVGALAFGTRRAKRFKIEEQELQHAIARQMAVALERIILIQELAANNRKLSMANAELRRANSELEQFAFLVSHDLREPIRHLRIYTEILRRRLDNQLDDEGRQCLRFVLLSADKLEMLVAGLLAYTRVHANPSEAEIDTNAVLGRVLEALRPVIVETRAVVRATDLPPLRVNDSHLAELFQQILDNALKFRTPGVPPEIDIFCYQTHKGAVLCVRDNGVGIKADHQSAIFGLFKRLDSSGYQGTGVGLAICQKIVERYQGQIWVESEIGKGSLFCFRLGEQTNIAKSRAVSASK